MKIGEYEMRNKAYWKQKDLQDMIKRAEKIISDPNHTPERRKELLEDYRIFITQKYLELSNWTERASKVPM
jgi:protein associated with RNAse G/E